MGSNYRDISAGGHARQHNGDHYGDSVQNYTYHHTIYQGHHAGPVPQSRNEALNAAAAKGQHHRVNKLLRDGADMDFAGSKGVTALHEASFSGHTRVVETLLTHGADVDAHSVCGTPIVLAALRGQTAVFQELLEAGASLLCPDGNLGSVLHAACVSGDPELVERILLRCPALKNKRSRIDHRDLRTMSDTDSIDPHGSLSAMFSTDDFQFVPESRRVPRPNITPLHVTAMRGSTDAMKCLVRASANTWMSTEDVKGNETVEALAVYFNHPDYLAEFFGQASEDYLKNVELSGKELEDISIAAYNEACAARLNNDDLEEGNEVGEDYQADDVCDNASEMSEENQEDSESAPPSELSDDDMANSDQSGRGERRRLHIRGRNSYGKTLIMIAACKGYHQCLDQLLYWKRWNIDARDSRARTALYLACYNGHYLCAELLLNRQADVSLAGFDSAWTPLMIAAYKGHDGCVCNLLYAQPARELEAHAVVGRGNALHMALLGRKLDMFQELIDAGVNMDMPGVWNRTPLMTATSQNLVVALRQLLAAGADVGLRDAFGKTARDIAVEKKYFAIVMAIDTHIALGTGDQKMVKC